MNQETIMNILHKMEKHLHAFNTARSQHDNRAMSLSYNLLYQDSLPLPPCNIVNSLKDDIENYRYADIQPDIEVIRDNKKDLM